MLSAFWVVRSLWAITTTVRPSTSVLTARCTSTSFSGSRLAVASSSRTTGASFRSALAMEIRCFSPPDRVEPPSPTIVSYPWGRRRMNSWAQARFAASSTSASVAPSRPKAMLFRTVSRNRYTSWNTKEIRRISFSGSSPRSSAPPKSTVPDCGS